MNLTIDRDVLIDNLNTISRGLPTKTPNPLLLGIKLYVTETDLFMTSSNSDISVEVDINDPSLEIRETGEAVVPGRFFIDIVRKINSRKINLFLTDDNILYIKVDRGEYQLKIMDPVDYPKMDYVAQDNPLELSSDELRELIRTTSFAASQSEKRPILTGVNFKNVDGKLIVTATDSFRLAQKTINIPEYPAFDIVVPSKSLDELNRAIDNYDGGIKLYFSQNKLLAVFKNVCFQTRLLDGNFPNTNNLILYNFPYVLKFNKDELLNVVESVSLLSPRDKDRDREITYSIIKLSLKVDRVIELSTQNQAIGGVNLQIIPTDVIANGPITIGFSSRYLLEALRSFMSTEVTLNLTGEVRPFIIRGDDDANLTQLILPVRIED